jgi:hypothetical protein
MLMNAIGIIELVVALAAVASALAAFNALVGKGPRGTVWLVAASVFTWASMLPVAFRDPDGGPLPRQIELIVIVLKAVSSFKVPVRFPTSKSSLAKFMVD